MFCCFCFFGADVVVFDVVFDVVVVEFIFFVVAVVFVVVVIVFVFVVDVAYNILYHLDHRRIGSRQAGAQQ